MPGSLYVVATPIGNLEDVTLRAIRVLREVDLIACEDTRQTAKLLSHYQIPKPTTSYHEHNEVEKAEFLLGQLQSGKQIALVSDAGTPCISDPGYRIVKAALLHQIRVVPIPGPCSFIAALSASGRPSDSFTFLGFLPARKNPRRTLLLSSKEEPRTLIFFEAPGRLLECLIDVKEVLGERHLTVAREITKVYEEVFFGSTTEAYDHFSGRTVKGEVIIILEKAGPTPVPLESLDRVEMERRLEELVQRQNISKSEAVKILSRQLNTSKRELYQLLIGNRKF